MKNIHVLPTDQPSRLYLEYGDGDLCLSNNLLPQTNKSNNQHIYITSDEEIKGNDYYIHNNRVRQSAGGEQEKGDYRNCKKIILTTDTTLIADGVQSISYHFLEWFVKNPTCEFVEIESWKTKGEWELVYKIIIPQEELKSFSDFSDKFFGTTVKEESKQETLEEAAKKYKDLKLNDDLYDGFIAGANYMAKRMFSEEEVKDIVDKTIEKFYKHRYADKTKAEMKELWFENFKKK